MQRNEAGRRLKVKKVSHTLVPDVLFSNKMKFQPRGLSQNHLKWQNRGVNMQDFVISNLSERFRVAMTCRVSTSLVLIRAACVYVTEWRPEGNTDWQLFNCLIFNMDIKVQVCSPFRQTIRPECSAEERVWNMKNIPGGCFWFEENIIFHLFVFWAMCTLRWGWRNLLQMQE